MLCSKVSIILGIHNQISIVTTGQRNSVSERIKSATSDEKNTPQNPIAEKSGVFLLQFGHHLNDRQRLTARKILPDLHKYVVGECHVCDAV